MPYGRLRQRVHSRLPVSPAAASLNPCLIWSYTASLVLGPLSPGVGEPRQPPIFHRQFNISATLDVKAERSRSFNFCSYNIPRIYCNGIPSRNVPSPISDVSAASLTTLKLAFLFHTVGWVIDHLHIIMYVED